VLLNCDVQQVMKFMTFENCTVLGYCTVSSGNSLPTFWDTLSVPSSRIKNPFSGTPFVKHTRCTH